LRAFWRSLRVRSSSGRKLTMSSFHVAA
jgi:hypothetical protein